MNYCDFARKNRGERMRRLSIKKIACILLILLTVTSCRSYEVTNKSYDSSKDIVILYSNKVSDNDFEIIKSCKESLLKETSNVTLVGIGDYLNIDMMNNAGYDYSCLGPNDFSKGLNALYNSINKANYKYLLCSQSYSGQTKDIFKKTVPYEIVNYDDIKVGYIGVLSPRYLETYPEYFMEDDSVVINFYNETEEVFYDTVQCSIDKAKSKGADYIVLLSNFDDDPAYSPYTLQELIPNLSDVNLVINGNEYTGRNEFTISDINNKNVLIISNGPLSSHFGKVTISNGIFTNESLDK